MRSCSLVRTYSSDMSHKRLLIGRHDGDRLCIVIHSPAHGPVGWLFIWLSFNHEQNRRKHTIMLLITLRARPVWNTVSVEMHADQDPQTNHPTDPIDGKHNFQKLHHESSYDQKDSCGLLCEDEKSSLYPYNFLNFRRLIAQFLNFPWGVFVFKAPKGTMPLVSVRHYTVLVLFVSEDPCFWFPLLSASDRLSVDDWRP
jgi:hypothetical protein